jgi:hypothetical protein
MKHHEALQEILKDLSLSFGDGLAERIVMSARGSAQDPVIGLDKEKYAEIVRTLCRDPRVVGMLGEIGAREKTTRWGQLVN